MRSRAREEKRLQREQRTVSEQRDERREQLTLGANPNVQATVTKEKRMERLREKEAEIQAHPRRVARVGKPLHR